MCGRFTLARSPEDVARAFGLDAVPNFPLRYNIAPSQPVRLISSLAKDLSIGAKLIDARLETVMENRLCCL
ncbi:SOS response-associated peptidase family protein [Altericista sp. CCNU0014]|uniref:SOS response-associated peptidase family protein n=1 Tax=Altericista sp. CCNU0014 TaxID=3082949 RepID=UPI00384FF744